MSASPWVTLLAVAILLGLCCAGMGLSVLLGRRRRIGACACEFDANAARRRARGCADPAVGCEATNCGAKAPR